MLLNKAGKGIKMAGPAVAPEGPPALLGLACRAHRLFDIVGIGLGNPGQNLAGCRVLGFEEIRLIKLCNLSTDEMAKRALVLFQPFRNLGRILRCRAVFHGLELVEDVHSSSPSAP